ncbi:MAG TPA: class I SAM-dependent methyltransferase [Phycisphaerae bacterium]|nr:class I SAM-dependent methyltransferase [Phycisphaerae bacterium]HRY67241.1 class I SAM-dependent methyltransferase [Phycisphaerae bacterium]HSA26389.1 class I SAM-dependent methyltransferase [Phycisphaerae bacterium]
MTNAAEIPCLVCGRTGFETHLDILLRCPACGFVTAGLEPPAEARRLYEGDYFTGGEYLDYLADEGFFKRNFRPRLDAVRRQCPGGRLLEIGAAYGFFMDLAKESFDTVGFEVNPEAVRYARERLGLDVRCDDFLAATTESVGGPIDVAVMWDVIEHLERPDRFLGHIANLSKPGACLFVTTGDIGSLVARIRGRTWRMIHPPSHLHYFSRKTMTRLLQRTGFEVVDVRPVGVARSLRQILYSVLALGLGMKPAYTAATRVVPATWGFTLNTYDIMQVTARCVSPGP